MKIKDNIEELLNNLTNEEHLYFFNHFEIFTDYLIDYIEQYYTEIFSDLEKFRFERQRTRNYWSLYFSNRYDDNAVVRISKSTDSKMLDINLLIIPVYTSKLKKGLFKTTKYWDDSDVMYTYHMLNCAKYPMPTNVTYNVIGCEELKSICDNTDLFQIRMPNERIQSIELLNEFVYNYISTIGEKIKEMELTNAKLDLEKELVQKKVSDIVINEFDKNADGNLDVLDGENIIIDILNKNQKKISEFDHTIIQKLVRLNHYLNQKRTNLSELFELLKIIDDEKELQEFLPTFRNSIENYHSLLIHSINMIIGIKRSDLITFYEIYESFDKLGIFNSNWENEISGELTSINSNLENINTSITQVIESIKSMEWTISNSIDNLAYTTRNSIESLNTSINFELKSIRDGISLNNLLTGINVYQSYKINKNTRNLR